jgi:hypothetical protein
MFKSTASYPEEAIVLIFDLEGFSSFFSQPDVHNSVPRYLNTVLDALSIVICGGECYYVDFDEEQLSKKENIYSPLPSPIHQKFLGDGMLYIWRYNDFDKNDIADLLIRLWNLKINFREVNFKYSEDVPVIDIPQKIRFGVSAGSVYKLTYTQSGKDEFIGFSINLGYRLQNYCRELGYIASARLNVPNQRLSKSKYKKVIAIKLKGFPREIVIVNEEEFNYLKPKTKKELFEELS